jgi:UDP-N-acetylglucosamine--N-acetylmuramyl-(pentapeptide) pyrophosphoryl-undecaprenol N-acetylglucosamine transferase
MGVSLLFAAGGTGGHLIPALAIADEVKQLAADAIIEFVGASGRMEAKVVPEHGYAFHAISVAGFQRRRLTANLFFPIRLVVALVQSWMLIRRMKPDVVVGTGGYVTGPPLFVASLCGIPTLIQEQNSYPGVTTRLLAKRVREVHLAFDAASDHLKRRQQVYLSGNPIRSRIGLVSREDAAAFFDLDSQTRTVLVTGGSQGAASINRAVRDILPRLLEDGVQVIWLTGQSEFERIVQAIGGAAENVQGRRVRVYGFLREMECAWAACDLVVCRAGAITLAEVTRAGVPSVLVPYPFAAADHQTENAKAMVEQGAAVLCKDEMIDRDLYPTVKELLANADRLQRMAAAARSMARPEAARTIAEAVLRLATGRHD